MITRDGIDPRLTCNCTVCVNMSFGAWPTNPGGEKTAQEFRARIMWERATAVWLLHGARRNPPGVFAKCCRISARMHVRTARAYLRLGREKGLDI
jgi:hypothetical protein